MSFFNSTEPDFDDDAKTEILDFSDPVDQTDYIYRQIDEFKAPGSPNDTIVTFAQLYKELDAIREGKALGDKPMNFSNFSLDTLVAKLKGGDYHRWCEPVTIFGESEDALELVKKRIPSYTLTAADLFAFDGDLNKLDPLEFSDATIKVLCKSSRLRLTMNVQLDADLLDYLHILCGDNLRLCGDELADYFEDGNRPLPFFSEDLFDDNYIEVYNFLSGINEQMYKDNHDFIDEIREAFPSVLKPTDLTEMGRQTPWAWSGPLLPRGPPIDWAERGRYQSEEFSGTPDELKKIQDRINKKKLDFPRLWELMKTERPKKIAAKAELIRLKEQEKQERLAYKNNRHKKILFN
jgi:hypothetical protein